MEHYHLIKCGHDKGTESAPQHAVDFSTKAFKQAYKGSDSCYMAAHLIRNPQ